MTISIVPSGSEIAIDLRESSQNDVYKSAEIVSLQDLLIALEQTPSKHLNMLRSTAARLSEFFDGPPAEVSIDSVDGNREEFSQYLVERKYKTNSLRSYRNYLRILIEKARELGWVPSQPAIPESWAHIYPLASQAKCAGPLKYFAKRGMSPGEVTEDDLRLWVQTMVQRNHSYDGASRQADGLRRILVSGDFNSLLSSKKVKQAGYGIPLDKFPSSLRREVEELLRWKQASFAPDRPSKTRHRPVTAKGLRKIFSELLGFMLNIQNHEVMSTIQELITEASINAFVSWSFDERRIKGTTIRNKMRTLYAALRHHPNHSSIGVEWFEKLIKSIPIESKWRQQSFNNGHL